MLFEITGGNRNEANGEYGTGCAVRGGHERMLLQERKMLQRGRHLPGEAFPRKSGPVVR
jgi:hypothetical protein